jgi:hypothetical protein
MRIAPFTIGKEGDIPRLSLRSVDKLLFDVEAGAYVRGAVDAGIGTGSQGICNVVADVGKVVRHRV